MTDETRMTHDMVVTARDGVCEAIEHAFPALCWDSAHVAEAIEHLIRAVIADDRARARSLAKPGRDPTT